VARALDSVVRDEREGNLFGVAGMVMGTRFPGEALLLRKVSDEYFAEHPAHLRHAEEVVRAGWITSFPRLRDTLTVLLSRR